MSNKVNADIDNMKLGLSDMTNEMKINFLINRVKDLLYGRYALEDLYNQTKSHLETIICECEGIDVVKWEEIKSIYKAKNFILANETLKDLSK